MRLITAAAVTAALALMGVASAQAQEIPPGEAAVTFSAMRDSTQDINYTSGWAISVAGYMNSWFAVVGEANGNYKHYGDAAGLTFPYSVWVHTITGGGRISAKPGSKARVFGQFLAGWGRETHTNPGYRITVEEGAQN